jgi:hypothetical protein
MNEVKLGYVFGALIGLAALCAAFELWRLPAWTFSSLLAYTARIAAPAAGRLAPAQQVDINLPYAQTAQDAQSNILELPGASSNLLELPAAAPAFAGVWGGYTRSAVYSLMPGALAAKGPDRISVTFGRQGDMVFIASELYTGPRQHIMAKPKVRMSGPTEASVTYEAVDPELDCMYRHRFKLLRSGKMAYFQEVRMYDRRTRKLVGTATQHALLDQLTTAQQRRRFAIPSRFEVSRGELAAARSFANSK